VRDMWRVSENEKYVTLDMSRSPRRRPIRRPTGYWKNIKIHTGWYN